MSFKDNIEFEKRYENITKKEVVWAGGYYIIQLLHYSDFYFY
ncbi:unnamed protein product [marine sediment metagenome]|uniref:Uncharacterized protein n=1 Tax=marine sediment metagenome TaxID=412755 RepID=X0ZN45_9ZZZZ